MEYVRPRKFLELLDERLDCCIEDWTTAWRLWARRTISFNSAMILETRKIFMLISKVAENWMMTTKFQHSVLHKNPLSHALLAVCSLSNLWNLSSLLLFLIVHCSATLSILFAIIVKSSPGMGLSVVRFTTDFCPCSLSHSTSVFWLLRTQ